MRGRLSALAVVPTAALAVVPTAALAVVPTAALAAVLVTALAVAAFGQTTAPGPGGPTTGGSSMADQGNQNMTKVPPPTASTRAFRDAATQMQLEMAIHYTGDPDKDFAAIMSAQHKGAIEMAKIELAHGTDPDMRRLAQHILSNQEHEISTMQAWRAKHDQGQR